MSFSAYARRVRDQGLPFPRRVSALRSCVQVYRPIGFFATLSFIEELAGPFQRDEAALIRALDVLAHSRAVRTAECRRYAAERTAAKLRGRRSPRPDEPDPCRLPGYWFGAPRQAAVHALKFWQRERLPGVLASDDPLAGPVVACVAECVAAGGALTPVQRQLLTAAARAAHGGLRPELWRDDRKAYFRTRDLLVVLRLVEVASAGGPAAAEPG